MTETIRVSSIPTKGKVEFNVEKKKNLTMLEFKIINTVMSPDDLRDIELPQVNPSGAVGLSGRGPLWLYGYLAHELHFARVLATFEPRLNKFVIVYAVDKDLIGKAIDPQTGEVSDAKIGSRGDIVVGLKRHGDLQIIDIKIVGDSFAEPEQLRKLPDIEIDWSKPIVIFGQMPVWLATHLAAKYSNKSTWFGVYDPRLKGAVVVARHSKSAPEVGEVVPLDPSRFEAQRKTKVVAVVGDPNSGKSVFLHLLSDALRAGKRMVLTQEGDVVAPTQHWSLYAPEIRKELKEEARKAPEERLAWIVNSLRTTKESNAVDVVLVDLGGGRPHEGVRVTAENLAILQHVDYIVIVSRDRESIEAWERELREKTPHVKIVARLLSIYSPEGVYSFAEQDAVWHLDRRAYVEKKIPEHTIKKATEIANLIASL